ncbi:hypothetical protein B0H17DRAFT_1141444 [Mycena rosella]|uniref:Uncharacterized protein n=1 Tax=Mycena rosella TaxID=1033263 RepID=A0AAD7CZK6_MYCRO|nr:hypothetical protein B0H17DRAFT_1141444 [Mycena rosella]
MGGNPDLGYVDLSRLEKQCREIQKLRISGPSEWPGHRNSKHKSQSESSIEKARRNSEGRGTIFCPPSFFNAVPSTATWRKASLHIIIPICIPILTRVLLDSVRTAFRTGDNCDTVAESSTIFITMQSIFDPIKNSNTTDGVPPQEFELAETSPLGGIRIRAGTQGKTGSLVAVGKYLFSKFSRNCLAPVEGGDHVWLVSHDNVPIIPPLPTLFPQPH